MKRNEPQTLAPIAQARLGQHPSHSRVAFQAAARVTAGWPSPEEFARGSDDLTFRPDLGMWVRGGRRDSDDVIADVVKQARRRGKLPAAVAVIHHDIENDEVVGMNLRTDSLGVAYDNGFRLDGAVATNRRVADACIHVLQGMKAIADSWDQMDGPTRASAQLAVNASRSFLRRAGIRSVGA